MIAIKTPPQVELMRQSGKISAKALKKAVASAVSGMSLKELDRLAEEVIIKEGAGSSFKTVRGYYWTSCTCVNDEVVHGIPRDITLKPGDIVSIDLGALYQGWHTDTAWSVLVGDPKEFGEKAKFLSTGEKALWKAVSFAVEGKRIGDISQAIQSTIESSGYSVVRSLIGHGVGAKLHEEPEIPGVGKSGTGPVLKAGMTLAIEVIYAMGGYEVYQKDDGWTIATDDGQPAGLFEMTVLVGKDKPEVLTDWRQ